MSVQIALGAPATRVASRKLGPAAGSRSPPASSVSAACDTSTFASTWGRWETVARIVSWVSGSIARALGGVVARVVTDDGRLEPLAGRQRDRAANQAEADDRDPHLAVGAPGSYGRGQAVEQRDRGLPVEAAVGDRLPVHQLAVA